MTKIPRKRFSGKAQMVNPQTLVDQDRLQAISNGTRVTCEYRGDHVGIVLADDDRRAWAGSLAFPESNPDPRAVKEHVARCKANGRWSYGKRAVLWDFGQVYWDTKLRPV